MARSSKNPERLIRRARERNPFLATLVSSIAVSTERRAVKEPRFIRGDSFFGVNRRSRLEFCHLTGISKRPMI